MTEREYCNGQEGEIEIRNNDLSSTKGCTIPSLFLRTSEGTVQRQLEAQNTPDCVESLSLGLQG